MKGTYFLLIQIKKDVDVKIGSLSHISFKKGLYVYVGSGLKNLEARIERHKNMAEGKTKKRFWHIDYLLSNPSVTILDIYYKEGKDREECLTAKNFAKFAKEIPRFGCGDCRCRSHLFYLS